MSEHPHATTLRRLFEAFARADLDLVRATIPEDAVWRFPGRRGQLAGAHRGRDAILGFFARVTGLTGGTFHAELLDVVANDAWAVVLFVGHAEREGRTLENPTCLRIRFAGDRIVEVWEFVWDLYAVDDFWA